MSSSINGGARWRWIFASILAMVTLASCGGSTDTSQAATTGTSTPPVVAPPTTGNPPVVNYSVGGYVSGMTGTGLQLENNAGDDLTVSGDGSFTFPTSMSNGASFAVTVKTLPSAPSQTCTVYTGTGTIQSANQTGVVVKCTSATHFAYVLNNNSSSVTSFSVDPATGALTQTGSLSGSFGGACCNPIAIHPSGKFAYIANSNVTAYSIDSATGTLTSLGPAVSSGSGSGAVAIVPNGRYAYVLSAGSNNISMYSVDASAGTLTPLGTVAASPVRDVSAVDPGGRYLFAGTYDGHILPYSIDATTGLLTALSPVATPQQWVQGLAVSPNGKYLYETGQGSSNTLNVYAIDASTGALTQTSFSAATGSDPTGIAIDPSGRFVYTAETVDNQVSAYVTDPLTGAISLIGTYASGPLPVGLAVDSLGTYLYEANTDNTNNTVWTYQINPTTGALTQTSSVSSSGSQPQNVAITP